MIITYETIKERELEAQIKRIINDKVIDKENLYNKRNSVIMREFYEHLKLHFPKNQGKLQTQKVYLQQLRTLITTLNKDLDKVNSEDIKKYLIEINEQFKPKTCRERKLFLIKFFPYLHDKGKEELRKTILKDVIITREQEELTDKPLLTPKDVNKLISVTNNFRDQAIISTLYETGSRKGELLRMRIKHVDLTNRKIVVPKGKTTSRILPIIDSYPYLFQWINTHPEKDNLEASLWVNQGSHLGRALHEDGLKRLIKILVEKAKLKKNITPHSFRHSKATEFSKQGVNEAFLRRWFGWSNNSRTPSLYIHLFSDDISDMYAELKGVKEAKKQFEEDKRELLPKNCPKCNNKEIPAYLKNCPNIECNYSFEMNIEDLKAKISSMEETFKLIMSKPEDFLAYVKERTANPL